MILFIYTTGKALHSVTYVNASAPRGDAMNYNMPPRSHQATGLSYTKRNLPVSIAPPDTREPNLFYIACPTW